MGRRTAERQRIADRLRYLNQTLDSFKSKKDPSFVDKVKKKIFPKRNEKIEHDELDATRQILDAVKAEIGKIIVGQKETVNLLICALLANGHVLLEAVPGVAKTVLIRSLARVSGCEFSRIQFTVDLLPTDITGITTYDRHTDSFKTIKGPIFANFVIADEINRAPPKTQSALLEAMQERQVTIGDSTYKLAPPFFVMATQNPIESSGTYRLPEAQIDRFLFKLHMDYPTKEEEQEVLHKNISLKAFASFGITNILTPPDILKLQQLTQDVYASKPVEEYIVRIVDSTRNPKKFNLGKYIQYGSSPRASIGMFIAAKAWALLNGKGFVTPQHVKAIAPHVLRHRLILNYEAQADGIEPDQVIKEILRKTPVP